MISIYKRQIKKIKEKLNNQKLSVLIGAGFSMNVSKMFPSWWVLLYEIAEGLYKSEIEDSYNTYLSSVKPKSAKLSKEEYFENKVDEIIKREGYLELVSEFIKRKGFRESITTYIEQKTPSITEKKSKAFLTGLLKGVKTEQELTDKMLTQHKMLLQLPWNNIYTTNYDTLLEHSVNTTLETDLSRMIEETEKEIESLLKEELIYSKRLKLVKRHEIDNNLKIENLIESEKKLSDESGSVSVDGSDIFKDNIYSQKAKIARIKSTVNFKLNSIKRQLKDKESSLLKLNMALNDCLTIVKHSSELKIKRNKNIIKLHGTLRSDVDSDFGFDGDIHKQYVIAKEDYETYPQKHEAFTQLMRISLLQESYVLVGFSGVDPNFISWIGWVRDILERKPSNNKEDYKIYLLDIDRNPISEEKRLFFKNHRIIRIPIMETEIITFLENETMTKVSDRSNPKDIFVLFFNYLSQNNSINNAKSTLEFLQQNKYKSIWQSISIFRPQEFKMDLELKKVPELERLKKGIRIPPINFTYSHNKNSLIYHANTLLDQVKSDKTKLLKLSKLIGIALNDSFITTDNIKDIEEINSKINDKDSKLIFEKLKIRNCVLKLDKKKFEDLINSNGFDNSDFIVYEEILFLAFSFDFNLLHTKIKAWKPISYRAINRASFLALFENKIAAKYLREYCLDFENQTNQEQLYAFQVLHHIEQSVSWSHNKDLNQRIDNYKNSGLREIDENLDYIIQELDRKRTKIEPYGQGRFSVSSGFVFSEKSSYSIEGLQFLQNLIETGIQLNLVNVYFKSNEKWYLVFKTIFEIYPYPALFYSLQYTDEKYIRRIAQDYAYSEKLANLNPELIIKVLDAYKQNKTPGTYKRSILIFVSELFIAVPANIWQDRYFKIWQQLLKNNQLFAERNSEINSFVMKALPFITDISILRKVILDILKNARANFNVAIGYLYNLSKNSTIKQLNLELVSNEIRKEINLLIDQIPYLKENSLFILGNLSEVLTEENKDEIKNKLKQTNLFEIKNERIWSVILYFANGDKTLIKSIKQAILKHDKLWYSGIKDQGVSIGQFEHINLENIRKTDERKIGLSWTKNESKTIYRLLLKEFSKIKKYKSKRDDLGFQSVLGEMYFFLENEKDKLNEITSFKEIFSEVKTLYFKDRGFESFYEGLLSEDSSTVIWALSEFFKEIYSSKEITHKQEFIALLNKIYFQKEPSLEACLSYIANYAWNQKDDPNFKNYESQLYQILKKYQDVQLIDYDKPFVEKRLIKIANVLSLWNNNNEVIQYWLTKEKKSHFNIIIQDILD